MAVSRIRPEDLLDVSRFVKEPEVDIFDEHEEVWWVDSRTGKPCDPGKHGCRKEVRRFGRRELEEIARNCNARPIPAPITIGHTDPEEKDERKQPPIVGYAHNYRVRFDPNRKQYMLRADFYFMREHYREAKTFPRPSIELWPEDDAGREIIDPIAILRRTPKRDLQWTYSRGEDGVRVYRYSRGLTMPEHEMHPGEHEMSHGEKMEQFMRHVFSHPHAKHFAHHYAMEEGAETPLPPPEPNPTEPPDGEEPERYGMAVPGATNLHPEHEMHGKHHGGHHAEHHGGHHSTHHSRASKPVQSARERDLEQRLVQMERKAAYSYSRNILDTLRDREGVTYLQSEKGYNDELAIMTSLPSDDARDAYGRKLGDPDCYARSITSRTGPLPIDNSRLSSDGPIDLEDPESLSPRDQERVRQYARETGEHNLDKAIRAALAHRFARNGTGTNGN